MPFMTFSENSVEWLVGLIVLAVVVAMGAARLSASKKRQFRKSDFSGPQSVRFTCAKCSNQFNHTRRTIAAWEKGSRRIFCNGCHKKWIDSRPVRDGNLKSEDSSSPWYLDATPTRVEPREAHPVEPRFEPRRRHESSYRSGGSGRSGCLGVVAASIVPVACLFAVVRAVLSG